MLINKEPTILSEQELSKKEEKLLERARVLSTQEKMAQWQLGFVILQAKQLIEHQFRDKGKKAVTIKYNNMLNEMAIVTGKDENTLYKYSLVAKRYPPEVADMYPTVDVTILMELLAAPVEFRKSLLTEIADAKESGKNITAAVVRAMIKERFGKEVPQESFSARLIGEIEITADALIIRKRKGNKVVEWDVTEALSVANGVPAVISINFKPDPNWDLPTANEKIPLIMQAIDALSEGTVRVIGEEDQEL